MNDSTLGAILLGVSVFLSGCGKGRQPRDLTSRSPGTPSRSGEKSRTNQDESEPAARSDLPQSALGAVSAPSTDVGSELFGKPAPELRQIKDWKNGQPVTLAQLRGKFVLLDFWGYWCGPCLFKMRELIALHDAFNEQGLVILAVHDDSVDSVEEMNEKLAGAREKAWGGRDIPFLVALDGGGPIKIAGGEQEVRGATTAAYRIQSFPTMFLIDPDGILVKQMTGSLEQAKEELAERLGVEADRPLSNWRNQLDELYRLQPNEVLRRIAPPFLPARQDYWLEEFVGPGLVPSLDAPKSLTFLCDDKLKGATTSGTRLSDVLESLGLTQAEYDGPAELLAFEVGGDWTKRQGAARQDLLRALEKIVSQELNQPLRIESRLVEREVVVATGIFELRPIAATNVLHVSAASEDLDRVVGGGRGSLGQLFSTVSKLIHRRVIDATESHEVEVSYELHPSIVHRFTADEDHPKLSAILTNLAKQTGLRFLTERRPVEVWFVRHSNEP